MTIDATSNFNNVDPDHITNLTHQQVRDLIDGTTKRGNQLWSEELSSAQGAVNNTGDAKMIAAFKELAFAAMTGDCTSPSGNGFSYRNGIGLAVQRMLRDGDTTTFDRMLDYNSYYDSWDAVGPKAELLMARIEVYCAKKGIELHTQHTVNAPDAGPRNERKL